MGENIYPFKNFSQRIKGVQLNNLLTEKLAICVSMLLSWHCGTNNGLK
jgi:hypothetical protein